MITTLDSMKKEKIIKWVLVGLFLAGLDTYLILCDWLADSSLFVLFVFWAAFGILVGHIVAKRSEKIWLGIICGILSFVPYYFLAETKAGLIFGVILSILVSNLIVVYYIERVQ